jgi:tRNA threonylcarbamoyladenosine biosynthesis protein TsaB
VKLLALDTSTDACSVAVLSGEDFFERHVVEPRAHTKILLPMIRDVLREAALEPSDLDALVLGNGPGSFIGMRISASVAQGICHAAGLSIVPVSSLAAIAAEIMHDSNAENVLIAQDARMSEIYVGRFRRDADGLPVSRGEEEIVPLGIVGDVSPQTVVAGLAWHKYDDLVKANQERIAEVSLVTVPHARFLLALGQRDFNQGKGISPEALLPAYIRTKVAEIPRAAS